MKRMKMILAVATVLGLLTASASAERLSGQFTYRDMVTGSATPIAYATVAVMQKAPGWWNWGHTYTAFTDANGNLDATIPFLGTGTWTSLRVYATNPAAQVFRMDDFTQPFYEVPGFPSTVTMFAASSPNDSFDFTANFADPWRAQHYNAATAIQIARWYADARRDPRETDDIGQVKVQMQNDSLQTYYDTANHQIRLGMTLATGDMTVIHEYAHYLEDRISGFRAIGSFHDGCRFLTSEYGGFSIAEPGIAWMEGFADYFAQAVALANPTTIRGNPAGEGTMPRNRMETPDCGTVGAPETVELFVAGALWDLHDTNVPREPGDRFCSAPLGTDTIIFQIFDHELDIGWNNPTLQAFANNWVGRGYELPSLLSTFGAAATNLTFPPATHRYLPFGANIAVWRPSEGNWYMEYRVGFPFQWGQPGDVPVPGDYDGDGFMDLAIWRPGDGNWWVILSATNRIQVTQWGAPTDIPLPADYDGDGEDDIAVYRPSAGLVIVNSDNCGPDLYINVGGGTPVAGDFDGDGAADAGNFDPITGWFVIVDRSFTQFRAPVAGWHILPVIGDYDGDGRSDFAVFNHSSGRWTIRESSTGAITTVDLGGPHFVGRRPVFARPVPSDYDGDGVTDPAVWYDDDGAWLVERSSLGFVSTLLGLPGDIPVPAR